MTNPPGTTIVVGQRVRPEKADRARAFRRVMTPAEAALWAVLRGGRLAGAKFRRQQVIDGLIVDFYCHGARLVVEVDGPVHDGPDAYDAARDAVLAGRGLRVLHVTNDQVLHHPAAVLDLIRENLTPPAPLSDAERGE